MPGFALSNRVPNSTLVSGPQAFLSVGLAGCGERGIHTTFRKAKVVRAISVDETDRRLGRIQRIKQRQPR